MVVGPPSSVNYVPFLYDLMKVPPCSSWSSTSTSQSCGMFHFLHANRCKKNMQCFKITRLSKPRWRYATRKIARFLNSSKVDKVWHILLCRRNKWKNKCTKVWPYWSKWQTLWFKWNRVFMSCYSIANFCNQCGFINVVYVHVCIFMILSSDSALDTYQLSPMGFGHCIQQISYISDMRILVGIAKELRLETR